MPESTILIEHLALVDLELVLHEGPRPSRLLVVQIDLGKLIPQVYDHQATLVDGSMVICGDLICLLGHEDVDDVHNDLADDLDLLFLEEDCIGLLKGELVAQLLKILNHTK